MAYVIGSHIDVTVQNVVITKTLPDESWICISITGVGDMATMDLWIPTTDPRFVLDPILPANWPPQENDVWIVPGVTPPAFVVGDGKGGTYFLTADTIRQAYTSGGSTLPPTTDDALTAYGNAMTLLYRQPGT